MTKQINVGISDYKIASAPDQLVTLGLGSCVGIALYAPKAKMGALSHIMLPDSRLFNDTSNWMKFADLAIPRIVQELKAKTHEETLHVKIVGGASMFAFSGTSSALQIGQKNVEAVRRVLSDLGLTIMAEDVGGKLGRSMFVDLETFDVRIRLGNRDEHVL